MRPTTGDLADLESVLLVGRLADAEPSLRVASIDDPPDAEGIPEVRVVALVKRPHQAEARLDGCDFTLPADLHDA